MTAKPCNGYDTIEFYRDMTLEERQERGIPDDFEERCNAFDDSDDGDGETNEQRIDTRERKEKPMPRKITLKQIQKIIPEAVGDFPSCETVKGLVFGQTAEDHVAENGKHYRYGLWNSQGEPWYEFNTLAELRVTMLDYAEDTEPTDEGEDE